MSKLLSPIQFTSSGLSNIALRLDDVPEDIEFYKESGRINQPVNITRRYRIGEEDEKLLCQAQIVLKMNYVTIGEDGTESEPFARFECAMEASAVAPSDSDDAELAEKVLVANTLSYIWGKIRNWYEIIVACTELGQLTLPAIDPYALLDADDERDS